MRRALLIGSFGLLGVGWIVGCENFRSGCDSNCDNSYRPIAQAKGIASNDTKAKSEYSYPKMPAPRPNPAFTVQAVAEEPVIKPAANEIAAAARAPRLPETPTNREPDESSEATKLPEVPANRLPDLDAVPIIPVPLSSGPLEVVELPYVLKQTEEPPMLDFSDPIPAPPPTITKIAYQEPARPRETTESTRTLVGNAYEWHKSMRLRYAPVSQIDPYGGYVILEGNTQVGTLHEGQRVRVTGVLIEPENRYSPARFRVQSLEIVE